MNPGGHMEKRYGNKFKQSPLKDNDGGYYGKAKKLRINASSGFDSLAWSHTTPKVYATELTRPLNWDGPVVDPGYSPKHDSTFHNQEHFDRYGNIKLEKEYANTI